MNIKNLKTRRGIVRRPEGISFALDGIHVQRAPEGETVNLSLELFATYLDRGWIEEAPEQAEPDVSTPPVTAPEKTETRAPRARRIK